MKLIERSERTALEGRNVRMTFNQLLYAIAQYSSLLDCKPHQRIVIFSENRPEWIVALYSIWKKGGIVVPVDVSSSQDDLDYIIHDSNPYAICCSREKSEQVSTAIAHSKVESRILVFEDLLVPEEVQVEEDFYIENKDQTALILYTSGTTGNPKGVMLSFQNIYTNLRAVCQDVPIFTPLDRTMILLPLHHILPLVGSVIAPLYSSGSMVLNTSLAAEDMLATLKDYKVTIMIGVPRLYQLIYKGLREKIHQSIIARSLVRMAQAIDSLKFSRFLFRSVQEKFGGNLKYLVCGGAPVDPAIVRLFKTLGFEILDGYGMTEAAPMITFTRPGKVTPGVPGELLPRLKIRFENDEILVSGENVMQGYYNKPAETAEVLKDNWLYTGDLGYMDAKNMLHITGRKKEIIILPNGKNINPEEVENILLAKSSFIKEAGVFLKEGSLQAIIKPDFRKLAENGIQNIDEYIRWQIIDPMNRSITPYKKILGFHTTSQDLPRTRLGKIKRYLLPGLTSEKHQETVEEPKSKEYQAIKKFLEEETQQKVHPGDHIELDLALDSLGRVSLSAFIDTAFGVDVSENMLADFPSISELATYVHQKKTRLNFEGISWSHILKEKVHLKLPDSAFTLNVIRNFFHIVFSVFMRVKARGLENLPDQACIIAPNHQSVLDGFLVASFFKRKFMKKTYVYAKEKHFRHPVMRFLANRNNIILVDVNKDLKLSIQKLAEVLKKGKNLMIFPEGTRTINGRLGEFKQTFAILSRELKVPVVPVVINGSYNVLPSGARLPRLFRKVSIDFLPPVYPENHTYESLKKHVHTQLENHLADHMKKV